MNSIAHISFPGGGLVVPSRTPYERELLVEHTEAAAKRHGAVHLLLDSRCWTIAPTDRPVDPCTSCSGRPGRLTYRLEGRAFCGQCARNALH